MEWDIFFWSALINCWVGNLFLGIMVCLFFTAIIALCYLLLMALTDDSLHEWFKEHKSFSMKILCSYLIFCLFCVLSSSIFATIPEAMIEANKNRIIYHYTSQNIVKEKLEPIADGYLKAIQEQLENPHISIEIKTNQKENK